MTQKLTGNQSQCGACGTLFKSVSGFDDHRTGSHPGRRCRTEAEMRTRGYEPNAAGFWRQPREMSACA